MTTPRRTPSGGNRVTFSDRSPSVESWAIEQAAHLLAETRLSPPVTSSETLAAAPAIVARTPSPLIRGTSTPLSIPLDTPTPTRAPRTPPSVPAHLNWKPANARASPSSDDDDDAASSPPRQHHTVHGRRTPLRRDSLKRREALLRGKEGSRRRQRWENDRLLHVPGAQPPLPSDWAQPVWPQAGREEYRPVPYFLAPLWEAKYASLSAARREAAAAAAAAAVAAGSSGDGTDADKERVARELRERMKKARGARGLLQDLELEVRNFLMQCEVSRPGGDDSGLGDARDESDDEIVFVGRNGRMSDDRTDDDGRERLDRAERLVFQSLERDHGASFGRWLVHSIADYYGLDTWSVTSGDPAQRSAYVGLRTSSISERPADLPRPLWVLV